jgi:hypothetical protein
MDIEILMQKPEFQRDDAWEHAFLAQFAQLKVQIESPDTKQGPDGWPYLFVRTGKGSEPVSKVVNWLADRGIGMAVNTHKMLPDYVFPYGMLWNFIETGRFLMPPSSAEEGDAVYEKKPVSGPPSEKYLPPYVRNVMKEFLRAQGFTSPRILVVSSADFKEVDLIFSLASLGQPPRAGHQKLAEMLAWFLPLHYTLVLGQEDGLPPFYDL